MSATSQEGPWQRARHLAAFLTKGSSDASSVASGGICLAGGDVPTRLVVEACQPERYVCPWPSPLTVLRTTSGRVAESTSFIDVDNQSVVGAFNRRCAKNRETHALLVQLLELHVENEVADAISEPSREAIIRRAPAAF